MTVLKWTIEDPADPNPATNKYTFAWNPNAMTSPFPTRALSSQGTTVDGQVVMWEGQATPAKLTFRGSTRDSAHYEAIRSWVYDRTGRMFLKDHFGRRMLVVFESFAPEPPEKHRIARYWAHSYTVVCWVLSISAPTVNDGGPV